MHALAELRSGHGSITQPAGSKRACSALSCSAAAAAAAASAPAAMPAATSAPLRGHLPERMRATCMPCPMACRPPLLRRGAPECVSRRWRRACRALPCRVRNLDVAELEDVVGENPAAVLRSSVQGRSVVEVNVQLNTTLGGPPRAWQELADAVPTTITRWATGLRVLGSIAGGTPARHQHQLLHTSD